MSTFRGNVKELENILIDNFTINSTETCFFLSHCHADHMKGLYQLLLNLQKRPNQYLYCSPISRLILLNKYKNCFEKEIKEINSPTLIQVPESDEFPSYQINVSPIPAGHCPGSLMFLFETVNKVILYTGDFRITKEDIEKFKILKCYNKVKSIDKLYFDCTFLNKTFWDFPLRTTTVSKIIPIIKSWLGKNPNHHLMLETPAHYGYEYVLVEVAKNLKTKIHVKNSFYDLYWNLPEIGCLLTKDCKKTKIHSFYLKDKRCKPCFKKKHLLTIKLSAQWYKSSVYEKKMIWKKISRQKILFCYSTHCSYSELVNFLNYLHPKELEACTSAVGCSEKDKNAFIREIIASWKIRKKENSPESERQNFTPEKNYKFKIKFPDTKTEIYEDFMSLV